ncbi:MAG: hypothetical protein Q4D89_05175 [Arachnia propionica]|uniref:hypothetical protein n=1 Tax=Arachnia propionica TaxID=1750 RepID=UPI0026FD3F6B|nr:hypothetical protein [Arachnia propionica]
MSTPHDPRQVPQSAHPGPDFQGPPPPTHGTPPGHGAPPYPCPWGQPGQFSQPGYGDPHQAHGAQVGPHQQYPHGWQPTHDPHGHPIPPAPRRNTALIIVATVVAVAVIGLGAAFAAGLLPFKGSASQEAGPGATDASTEPSPTSPPTRLPSTPKEVVEDYLGAIARGDAEAARALIVDSTNPDKSLLTDEVLKESLTRAPMTDITVEEGSGSNLRDAVKVTYTLGGEVISDELNVNMNERKIHYALPHLYLGPVQGLAVKVNGVVPQSDRPLVFPGSYQVVSDNEYLEVAGENIITRKYSSDHTYTDLKVQVSQAGIDLYREKVVPEVKACLASTQIDPGCEMALSATSNDGATITEGTVVRTLDAEGQQTLENVVPRPGYDIPTVISANDFGYLRITARCTTADGGSAECRPRIGAGTLWSTASIDVTDPDLKVVWSRR